MHGHTATPINAFILLDDMRNDAFHFRNPTLVAYANDGDNEFLGKNEKLLIVLSCLCSKMVTIKINI